MSTKIMNLRRGEIMNFYNCLLDLSEVKLPLKVSNMVLETIAVVEPHLKETLENQKEINEKLCKRGDDGMPVILKADEKYDHPRYDYNTEEDRRLAGENVNAYFSKNVEMITGSISFEEFNELQNISPPIMITVGQLDVLKTFVKK